MMEPPAIRKSTAVRLIRRSTPIVLRLSPPRNGAKPETDAPAKFRTPVVDARKGAGTTSKAHGAWLPDTKPMKKPKAMADTRVSASVGTAPRQKMHGAPNRKPAAATQNRLASVRL